MALAMAVMFLVGWDMAGRGVRLRETVDFSAGVAGDAFRLVKRLVGLLGGPYTTKNELLYSTPCLTTGAFKAKVSKDLAQAAALMSYFAANDPDALQEAWADALSRGPGRRKRALEGAKALGKVAQELARTLTLR